MENLNQTASKRTPIQIQLINEIDNLMRTPWTKKIPIYNGAPTEISWKNKIET
jgi:hypothetical protein